MHQRWGAWRCQPPTNHYRTPANLSRTTNRNRWRTSRHLIPSPTTVGVAGECRRSWNRCQNLRPTANRHRTPIPSRQTLTPNRRNWSCSSTTARTRTTPQGSCPNRHLAGLAPRKRKRTTPTRSPRMRCSPSSQRIADCRPTTRPKRNRTQRPGPGGSPREQRRHRRTRCRAAPVERRQGGTGLDPALHALDVQSRAEQVGVRARGLLAGRAGQGPSLVGGSDGWSCGSMQLFAGGIPRTTPPHGFFVTTPPLSQPGKFWSMSSQVYG